MKTAIGALAMLAAVTALPAGPAAAQDALLGGVLGGAAGAAIGGAVSGSVGGAIAGGIIGGATGAIIGNEAERRRNGYYYLSQRLLRPCRLQPVSPCVAALLLLTVGD